MKSYKAIADYYDAEYADSPMLKLDVPFFLGCLPKKKRLTVLDVACGTGRSCIPVAQAGHRVVGIDYHAQMLALAEQKRDAVGLRERELKLVKQDALSINLAERFDYATIFFNTFLSFTTLDQQDRLLRSSRKHLKRAGRLWLDIFQPNLEILSHPESRDHDRTIFFVPALQRTVQRSIDIRRDRSRQVQHVAFKYTWFDKFGIAKRERVEFEMTYLFPRELQLLLERNGFAIERVFGDYDGSALTMDSPRMIVQAVRHESK